MLIVPRCALQWSTGGVHRFDDEIKERENWSGMKFIRKNVDFLREAVSPRESDVCERDEQVRSTLCPNIAQWRKQ